jgi:hypothetical protein
MFYAVFVEIFGSSSSTLEFSSIENFPSKFLIWVNIIQGLVACFLTFLSDGFLVGF